MPNGILFTKEEYVLCTYAARYGDHDLGVLQAINLRNHPPSSVLSKVRNIATDIRTTGRAADPKWKRLTGRTTGMASRFTGWYEFVAPVVDLPQVELLRMCNGLMLRAADGTASLD